MSINEDKITQQFNFLNSDQIQQFVENYAERIVDDMDTKTLMRFAFDVIVENLSIQGKEEILEQVSSVYDDDVIEQIIADVKS